MWKEMATDLKAENEMQYVNKNLPQLPITPVEITISECALRIQ